MKAILISAFVTGVAGSAHCLAMCGGIGVHLGLHSSKKRFLWFYHLGRIGSYVLLAWFLGHLLWLFGWRMNTSVQHWPRWLVAFLMLLLALQIAFPNWRLGARLERFGWRLWRKIQPHTQGFLPVRQESDALIVGLLWGLLPCGLIYSALALALATANPYQAALVMLAFGLGTLPALLLFQHLSQSVSAFFQQRGRWFYAALLLFCAAWTAYPLL